MTCAICAYRSVYALGRCRSCYVFRRRHRRDRSEAEAQTIDALAEVRRVVHGYYREALLFAEEREVS